MSIGLVNLYHYRRIFFSKSSTVSSMTSRVAEPEQANLATAPVDRPENVEAINPLKTPEDPAVVGGQPPLAAQQPLHDDTASPDESTRLEVSLKQS
jgi:hypothetical protein